MAGHLTLRRLRERLAAHLVTQLGGEWQQSVYPLELQPYDTRPQVHRSWAIGVPASTTPASLDRQRPSVGSHVTTVVTVGWVWRLRDDDVNGDIGRALDGEAEVIVALSAVDTDPDLSVQLGSLRRRVTSGEGGHLMTGTIELVCHHLLALA